MLFLRHFDPDEHLPNQWNIEAGSAAWCCLIIHI